MFNGFTNRCKKIVNQYARFEAERFKHKCLHPEHILIAILKEGQSNAYTVMNEVIDLINFQFVLESHAHKLNNEKVADSIDILLYYNLVIEGNISERTKYVLQSAIEESREIGARQIDTFALFIACCREEESISNSIINKHGVQLDEVKSQYYQYITSNSLIFKDRNEIERSKPFNEEADTNMSTEYEGSSIIPDEEKLPDIKNVSFKKFVNDLEIPSFKSLGKEFMKEESEKQSKSSKLSDSNKQEEEGLEYLNNLNSFVLEKNRSHIFGREEEIQQIFKVLLRQNKNNPVLVGDPGVGKSAIVEEIALRIVEGNVPLSLLNVEILQLDIASLTAGTRYRGDFEERLLGVIQEIQRRKSQGKQAILFIDEFHHIVGAGLANGLSMDGAGILKPALARGEVCCIGITTAEEYRKFVEADKAFTRRLQKVNIPEMSDEDTYLALEKIKTEFESKHNVQYEDDALREIIRLSKNYIFDRFFPDKAVDLLDEIGAYYKLKKSASPKELSELYIQEREIGDKVNAFSDEIKTTHANFETAEQFLQNSDELRSVIERKNNLKESLLKNIEQQEIVISTDKVREVVALSTGIPTDRLDENKANIIHNLEQGLQNSVVGQTQAIHSLISTVKRSFVGLHNSKRPMGSFLFLGPTGVGKTFCAKKLAHFLFGSEDLLSRFDMSDFAETNSVNRLIGAPPGYVGFEESGILLKLMRRNPRQVLLFDEIEKAHARVFDIFLQILEEGSLQGQMGEVANFRHSIIIMTSNIGSKELLSNKNFGFGHEEYNSSYVNNIVHEELSSHFRPELVNRFDEIITFDPLDDKEILDVIELMTRELSETLRSQGVTLKIQPNVHKLLYEKYFQIEYGARSVRRGLRALENKIAETMIDKNVTEGMHIVLNTKQSDFVLKVQHAQKIEDTQIPKKLDSVIV